MHAVKVISLLLLFSARMASAGTLNFSGLACTNNVFGSGEAMQCGAGAGFISRSYGDSSQLDVDFRRDLMSFIQTPGNTQYQSLEYISGPVSGMNDVARGQSNGLSGIVLSVKPGNSIKLGSIQFGTFPYDENQLTTYLNVSVGTLRNGAIGSWVGERLFRNTSPSVPLTVSFDNILDSTEGYVIAWESRSGSFAVDNLEFTMNAGPSNIAMPTILDGTFHFDTPVVRTGQLLYVDPEVAIGYEYRVGSGGPTFASVLLPDIGDGLYTIEFSDVDGTHSETVESGTLFSFGGDGVASFRLTGIEVEADLDPADASAFVTGLTFTGDGAFTGTMTPIVVSVPDAGSVPEPATSLLAVAAVLGMLRVGRRRPATTAS